MLTGYIYLIHNIISNKVYVGQTARPIYYRWSEQKFSKEDVLAIRQVFEKNELNMTYKQVALLYNTVPSVIFNIVKHKTYKEL